MSELSRTALLAAKDLDHLVEQFRAGRVVFVQEVPFAAQACLALNLAAALARPVLWLGDGAKSLDLFYDDLLALAGAEGPRGALFPALEESAGRSGSARADAVGDRLRTLQHCLRNTTAAEGASSPGPVLIATCVQALLQPTIAPRVLQSFSRTLAAGDELDPAHLAAELERYGYEFAAEVQEKGQAALRGGLLDVWPVPEAWPVRLEFVGATLESLRSFDPVEQRSRERRTSVTLAPAGEHVAAAPAGECGRLLDYLAPETLWIWSAPDSIRHHAALCLAAEEKTGPAAVAPVLKFDALRLELERRFPQGRLVIGMDSEQSAPAHVLDVQPCAGLPALEAGGFRPDVIEQERKRFVAELKRHAADGWRVDLFFNTAGTRDRFLEIEREHMAAARPPEPDGRPPTSKASDAGPLHVHVSPLSGGFTVAARRWMAVAESDLYGFRKALPGRYELHGRRTGPARAPALRVATWTDLQPGDLVVHVDHGIGRYLGLYEIEVQGRPQEVLAVEYAEQARLCVPVSQAHVLSRYVGLGRRRPDLHALGGRRWAREKTAAATASRDLAAQLLETQAARATLPGHAYAPDTPWQHEFETAFPYQETPDQLAAITAVKRDMESARPMDRLICGDVGYGKTEVAMRAAFKAVMDGRQVPMLVPTTILAQQHFATFAERFAAYPFRIEMLSRFRSREQQAEVVRRLRDGSVDIVIGTHRLVQKDVAFKELGLVIIDEEQRFGVAHKEQIKQLRQLVDVLTLTATPIPRTLYFSLTGARDLSTIQTPPRDRLPIETIVAPFSDELVRTAILREINRGGQVFYLHNRVQTIGHVLERLRALVPEARLEAAHGQMPEGRLAGLMRRFVGGEFDVLLCTTIIESGVDIPAVNTILIEHADRFGLADLYQLRGRVGRYKHQAYAYLLLPRHGRLFDTARQRIGAIKQYGSLGAGFKLALRDLEIRGAGNLLGAEQSGHIAAVGFDLYCQLLKRSVAALKGEKPALIVEVETRLDFLDLSTAGAAGAGAAVLPHEYIEDESLRVRAYGEIAAASSAGDLTRLRAGLRDRFGPLPPAAERLLKVARLRILAAERQIQFVEVIADKVMLRRGADWLQRDGRFPRLQAKAPAAKLDELIRLVRKEKGDITDIDGAGRRR